MSFNTNVKKYNKTQCITLNPSKCFKQMGASKEILFFWFTKSDHIKYKKIRNNTALACLTPWQFCPWIKPSPKCISYLPTFVIWGMRQQWRLFTNSYESASVLSKLKASRQSQTAGRTQRKQTKLQENNEQWLKEKKSVFCSASQDNLSLLLCPPRIDNSIYT